MSETEGMKIVHFDQYCEKCVHKDKKENEEPCNECLSEPAIQYSHKPVKFESR